MNLKTCIMTDSTCYKEAGKVEKVGIVVHSTGANNPYVSRYVQPLKTDKDYAAIIADIGLNKYGTDFNHMYYETGLTAFIGKNAFDQVVTYQVLPEDHVCWGVGRGNLVLAGSTYYSDTSLTKPVGKTAEGLRIKQAFTGYSSVVISGKTYYVSTYSRASYNYYPYAHIQFEICEDGLDDPVYFNAAMKEAQEYCAYICKKYDWSADVVCSHAEAHARGYAINHADPDHWLAKYGKDMNWFRGEVSKLLGEPEKKVIYRVQVGAFSVKPNAEAMAKKLRAAGYDTIIKSETV